MQNTSARPPFQPHVSKHANGARNIVAIEHNLYIKCATDTVPSQQATVSKCYFEAKGAWCH